MVRSRAPFGFLVTALSCGLAFAAACAEANLPPEEESVPLPDRDGVTVDAQIIDAPASVDAADAADAKPSSYRVFVTSSAAVANYGGLKGADGVCQTLAMAQGFPGTYVAWLSTKAGDRAVDRVTSPGPWQLVTGELVADSKATLVGGTLQHAIDHDEKGAMIVNEKVWTGTGPDGAYSTNDCDAWSTGSDGRVGTTAATDPTWTSAGVDGCGNLRRLYCFQN